MCRIAHARFSAWFLAVASCVSFLWGPPPAGAHPEAENRGLLSLAWDAHESGLCEEVLRYADDITRGSSLEPEGLWLRTDCLRTLGRYAEAVSFLESPLGRTARDWRGLFRSAVEDWVWSATEEGEYRKALAIAGRGVTGLPGEPSLVTLRSATAFRKDMQERVKTGTRTGTIQRLPTGEEFVLRKGRGVPPGRGWVRVYPWKGDTAWVPQVTLDDWMPGLADTLARDGTNLWMRISPGLLDRFVAAAARAQGVAVHRMVGGARFLHGGEETLGDREEWAFRAAVEGLGARGAAEDAVASALSALKARRALFEWVNRSRGALSVLRDGPVLRLRHPTTGRSYALDADSWASTYDLESKEWSDFWTDLSAELGRAPGAFRCFCGREALLRETLTNDPGQAVVVEKGKGYSVVLAALCPLHQQFVTSDLLKEWHVTLPLARERAQRDAGEKVWDLSFERGEEGGTRYLAFRGEGASSLARRPDLLLGALEAVEGSEVRGTSVQVLAPTASSLVVVGDGVPVGKAQAAATKSLLRSTRRGDFVDRLGYRATLKLPPRALGVFEVHSTEDP